MGKKPTPKKRLSKDRGRRRHSTYLAREVVRLKGLSKSPFSKPAGQKDRGSKALEKITKIKA